MVENGFICLSLSCPLMNGILHLPRGLSKLSVNTLPCGRLPLLLALVLPLRITPPFYGLQYGGSPTTFRLHQATDCALTLKSTPEPWSALPLYQDYSFRQVQSEEIPLNDKRHRKERPRKSFFGMTNSSGSIFMSFDINIRLCVMPCFLLQRYGFIIIHTNK